MTGSLQQRIEASPYLSRLYQRTGISLELDERDLLVAIEESLTEISDFRFSENMDSAEQFLIRQKHKFVFCWSLCELQDYQQQAKRGQWQTRFAETTIQFALCYAWAQVAAQHREVAKLLEQQDDLQCLPGLFVFGMGKLGGGDLNFSSDVDLVAFFDSNVLAVPDMLGKGYICHKVLQQATRLLGQNGGADFIWRVDWRLRPNASATTLAMSCDAARDYYFYRASPWHRLALMKARVVAGDNATGQAFLNSITPFIWRQNLDFRALDELAEIKQRINLEHPALRAERLWREPIADQVSGFNVKLGTGGIREIEFTVNALQLVWGGKQYPLRTPNTLAALTALGEQGHLDAALVTQLAAAYRFLRRVENVIQMLENQQTHLLPSDQHQQQNLLLLLGLDSWDALVDTLNAKRRIVATQFEALFAEHDQDHSEPLVWPTFSEAATEEIIESWENGFYHYGVSNQLRQKLAPLTRALAAHLVLVEQQAKQSAKMAEGESFSVDEVVLRLHQYFKSLPQGETYFRLLAASPRLLDSVLMPLLYSPPMTKLLRQSPHIIDCFVQAPWNYQAGAFDAEYVMQADNYEIQLERLRRFVNEYLYQLYLQFLQGEIGVTILQQALTELAEQTLGLSMRLVANNMSLSEVPVSVLGLGKLGLRKMSPTSDLDLIFVFSSEQTSLDLATRFVSRLQTAISTPMREGIVYELDTRLRPSGRSGAPTVSLESFATHHLERGRTWEHIALLSGRVIAGGGEVEHEFDKVKQEVLNRRREPHQFRQDAYKMWQRVAEHRIEPMSPELLYSKLREGGLMQAEYLAACLMLDSDLVSENLDFNTRLQSVVTGSDIEGLDQIIQFWRVQQLWERLLGKSEQAISSLPNGFRELLLEQCGVASNAQLIDKNQQAIKQVTDGMDKLFSELEDFDAEQWQESPVSWLK